MQNPKESFKKTVIESLITIVVSIPFAFLGAWLAVKLMGGV